MFQKKKPTLVAGRQPEGTGDTKAQATSEPVSKDMIAALVNQMLTQRMAEYEAKMQSIVIKEMASKPSRREVNRTLSSIVTDIFKRFVTKDDKKKSEQDLAREGAEKQWITRSEAEEIAREAVPSTLRDLDNSAHRTGIHLLLQPAADTGGNDAAYWGQIAPSGASGDKVLYKGEFFREYDATGTIIAVGSEINPADYATQALYAAALTAAGHSLKLTYDWSRYGTDITP